jgi:NAD(P)-dependent dehydrogenase (short-subunit alcohol dehydrogenase family)
MSTGQPVALVSGASRGIGREIARRLAADHGFLVLAGARNPDDIEQSDSLRATALDVTDAGSVDAAREWIESDPGRLDVLVNNAGVMGRYVGVADYDLELARRVLDTNLFGALRLTQAMLPLLRRSERARIVNVSSGMGQFDELFDGGPAADRAPGDRRMGGNEVAYRISKAGLNALTNVVAAEERGILANSLCPGWVQTDMGGRGAPRTVEEGADTAVWLATLPDDGPSGGFFRDREPIPW